MKYNYKITIAYDGGRYFGWQIQPNQRSIQELIEETCFVFLRHKIKLIGASRTDSHVHALGQVANFTTEVKLSPYHFLRSANSLLPNDVRIRCIEEVPLDFHAQYSAKGKIYHYHLYLDPIEDPFKIPYTYRVLGKCDLQLLEEALPFFIGTHDFTSFANSSEGGVASYDSIRTIHRLEMCKEEGGVRLEFEGDGFLYKMVRNIMGTLLEVALKKRLLQEIPSIFDAKDRRKAGRSVPPHGLFLIKVCY